MGRGLALAVGLIRRAGPDGRFLPWQLHRRIPSSVPGLGLRSNRGSNGHKASMCVAGGYCDRCQMLAFCAFCLSWVPPVGLIGPDLQQFKRKLHKNAPRRGTGAAVWLWLLPVLLGRI